MSDVNKQLEPIRKQIDALDQHIQQLLNERGKCALEVAKVKEAAETDPIYYRPEREAQVLRRVMERNEGPIADEDMARIFRTIMSAGLAIQKPMKVAFLGPEGTFAHSAALKHFGPCMRGAPMNSIDQVFRLVESKNAHYGVVPIENSTEGVVNHTLDLFVDSTLQVCGEVSIPIHQHLLNAPQDDTPIKRIYSHQQSLAQCRHWLTSNWPDAELIAVSSNAKAAEIAKNEPGAAAIAGEMAADTYDLIKVAEKIEDNPNNTTRFFIIGHQAPTPSGKDKTSLLVKLANEMGTLAQLLNTFAEHQVNVIALESRPSRQQPWNYLFFVDIDGHIEDANIEQAMQILNEGSVGVKVLGAYPKAVL